MDPPHKKQHSITEHIKGTPALILPDMTVKKFFGQIIKLVDGVLAIAVTDREGVPLVLVKDDKLPQEATKSKLLSATYLSFEQADKLGFGESQNITAFFTNYQLVCFNKQPLYVTIIAERNANTGHILSLEREFAKAVDTMRTLVDIPVV